MVRVDVTVVDVVVVTVVLVGAGCEGTVQAVRTKARSSAAFAMGEDPTSGSPCCATDGRLPAS